MVFRNEKRYGKLGHAVPRPCRDLGGWERLADDEVERERPASKSLPGRRCRRHHSRRQMTVSHQTVSLAARHFESSGIPPILPDKALKS
jgi:hypothetical protein